jgi:RHS repeat-associated protein
MGLPACASRFTGKKRDTETGLDYFGARYYSNGLGRYTSADEPGLDQHRPDPQSWNLYTYGRNNPLLYVDPNGEYVCGSSMSSKQCSDFQNGLDKAQGEANKLKDANGSSSVEYKDAQRAIDAYGEAGVNNGVTIQYDKNEGGAFTQVYNTTDKKTADNPTGQKIVVTMGPKAIGSSSAEAHEGSHVADGSAWVKSGFSVALNPTLFATEYRSLPSLDIIATYKRRNRRKYVSWKEP